MKIYYVRHQAHGVVHDCPFINYPSTEQVDAIKRRCFQSFGAEHPVKGMPWAVDVVAFEALDADEIPDVPERSLSVAGVAPVGEMTVSGVAHVANPKGGK